MNHEPNPRTLGRVAYRWARNLRRAAAMKPDHQAEIRAAFKERRLRLGLVQRDMADLLGIHRMTYIRLETSPQQLKPEMRARIHQTLLKLEADLEEQIKP